MRTEPIDVDPERRSTESVGRVGSSGPSTPPRRRWGEWTVGIAFVLTLVAASVGVYLLARTGWRSILDSNDGQLTEVVTNPALPGYEAVVEPTPSQLLVQLDADGGLVSVMVVGLAGEDRGGTVLFVPAATRSGEGSDLTTLDAVWASAGADGLQAAVAEMLDVNFGDVQVLDPARWTALLAPLAPIDVVVPDALVSVGDDGIPVTRFSAGSVALEADEVGEYLAWSNPGESGVNVLVRQELFWDTWLEQIAGSSDPDVVPGEVTTGLGRFVRALAAGPQDFRTLPVEQIVQADEIEQFEVIVDEIDELVVEMLPFPLAATPGSRPLVRVLNGVGDQALTLDVASQIVAAGGQVTIIGNAEEFGVTDSVVLYRSEDVRGVGEDLAAALGLPAAQLDPSPNPAIEVTVLIGSDLAGEGDS